MHTRPALACFLSLTLAACGGDNTPSAVQAPGVTTTPATKALDLGAAALQKKPPVEALNEYLDGFHFYSGRLAVQMEAHHYCALVNEEVTQCVIYDGNVRDAKLMGVEYIISKRLYGTLPAAEKQLWHSHVHEVKSGQLIAPGIPQPAEHALMEKIVGTYGKTWHTWHTDLNKTLPLGVPQLMMGFTADGQADPAMVQARDQRFGIDSAKKREDRASIAAPPIDPDADAWQKGQALQLADPTGQEHTHPQGAQSAPVHRSSAPVP